MRVFNRTFLFAAGLALILSAVLLRLGTGQWHPREWALAFLITLLHAAAAAAISRKALRSRGHGFFIWGLGMHGVRLVVLLLVLAALKRMGLQHFGPLALAVVTGYFCFLYPEILSLHRESLKDYTHE